MDPIDKMLQGDDTPQPSQAQQGQQDDATQTQSVAQQTEEEVEFSKLSGSTQDRIRDLVRRAKDAENKLGSYQQPAYVPPAPNTVTPDQKQAVETLSQFGIATDEKVDRKVNEGLNQIKWELKNQTLETKYSGQNGEPRYDREEVEDYMRSHPQYQYYDPEDVFKFKMFPDEFATASSGQQRPTPSRNTSLKPTRSNQQVSPMSDIDQLQRRLAEPDGDEYYEAHKDEINAAVAKHTNQFKGVNFGGQ